MRASGQHKIVCRFVAADQVGVELRRGFAIETCVQEVKLSLSRLYCHEFVRYYDAAKAVLHEPCEVKMPPSRQLACLLPVLKVGVGSNPESAGNKDYAQLGCSSPYALTT